jgi:hypothetical protein
MLEPDRPQIKIWRMRIACWIPKATDTHSECALLIAFPLQQWLHDRASMLRLYVHCLLLRSYRVTIKEIDTFNVVLKRNY